MVYKFLSFKNYKHPQKRMPTISQVDLTTTFHGLLFMKHQDNSLAFLPFLFLLQEIYFLSLTAYLVLAPCPLLCLFSNITNTLKQHVSKPSSSLTGSSNHVFMWATFYLSSSRCLKDINSWLFWDTVSHNYIHSGWRTAQNADD